MFRREVLVNFIAVLILPLLGLLAVLAKSSEQFSILLTAILPTIGFFLFLKVKMTQIRKGRYISFGTEGLSKSDKTQYFIGYVLMAIGLSIAIFIFII